MTLLTRISVVVFKFEEEEMEAFEMLKELITTTPVLIRIDYASAKIIQPLPRGSDDGLVIVAIDSCKLGAGWTLCSIGMAKSNQLYLAGAPTTKLNQGTHNQKRSYMVSSAQ